MTSTIHFGEGLDLPLDAVTQTFAFLARRGAGKTYGASKLCEGMLEAKAQVVVIDPVGNWYGLRLAANGRGRGFAIPVLGGLQGDVPLEPGAGALVADLVIDRRTSVVLDVSMFRKAERKRFVTDFAEQLFHRKKSARSAVHLFVEEAQVFVPQRVQADETRMLGAFEDLVKLGRNFGIGVTLISQRPQALNKDALNQTECLVVLQTNGAQERKALRDWIVDQGLDVGELIDSLPGLKRGEAWVWSPSWLRVTKRIRIAKKCTFDASATPEAGAPVAQQKALAPVELEQLLTAMADTVAKAEQEDPRALRARVAKLEAELARRPAAQVEVKVKEVPVISDGQLKRLDAFAQKVVDSQAALAEGLKEVAPALRRLRNHDPRPMDERLASRPVVVARRAQEATSSSRPQVDGLRKGELRMLEALGRSHPARRSPAQLGTLSGFAASGGTFRTYLGTLKRTNLVTERDGLLELTPEGLARLGDSRPAPQSPDELLAMWRGALRSGERKMLDQLVGVYPRDMRRDSLGEASGFEASGGTFRTYLGTLVRNGLVEVQGAAVKASPSLFLGEA